jgi:DNA-binding NarL/FixJ family response regulator
MPYRRKNSGSKQVSAPVPFPLDVATWHEVVREMQLPRQQTKVIELILRRMSDRQIAATMGISVPTVRTYLGRVFIRIGVRDRMELVLRILTLTQELNNRNDRRRQ